MLLRREAVLLPNRRFLMEIGDLTDIEVAEFALRIVTAGPRASQLRDFLGDGLLFRAAPA